MGDAKRRKSKSGSGGENNRRAELRSAFERLGINYSKPGFYDDSAFIAHEKEDRLFTEAYAEWVLVRERTLE